MPPLDEIEMEVFTVDEQQDLTEQQRRTIAKWLDEHHAYQTGCPICGNAKRGMTPHVAAVTVRTVGPEPLIRLDIHLPALVLFCTNCYNMTFHNLRLMGIEPFASQGDPSELAPPAKEASDAK